MHAPSCRASSPCALLAVARRARACGLRQQAARQHHGETEGTYLDVGPLTYQVQISRQLNPYDIEDQTYLQGLRPVQAKLAKGETWFGVFLRVSNETTATHPAANEFNIVDTPGRRRSSRCRSCPTTNPFTYKARGSTARPARLAAGVGERRQGAVDPGLDAAVQAAATASLDNRPLELDDPGAPRGERRSQARRLGRDRATLGRRCSASPPLRDARPPLGTRRLGAAHGAASSRAPTGAPRRARAGAEQAPTATRGSRTGAKAANHASVSGAWRSCCRPRATVLPSSAVPVLPATVTPGIAAAVPVPHCDHRDHHPAHRRGRRAGW